MRYFDWKKEVELKKGFEDVFFLLDLKFEYVSDQVMTFVKILLGQICE